MRLHSLSAIIIVSSLTTACGMVKVKGVNDPSSTTSTSAKTPAAKESSASSTDAQPAVATKTEDAKPAVSAEQRSADQDAERNLTVEFGRASEIKRTGHASISDAMSGFDANEFKTYISGFYKGSAKPTAETLAKAVDAKAKEKAAFEAAASENGVKLDKGAADAATLKAIKDHFVSQHPGVTVKAAQLAEAKWAVNLNDVGRPRNRYKTAQIVIPVKDSKACMVVMAVGGQNSNGAGGFESKIEFDEPLEGIAMACP